MGYFTLNFDGYAYNDTPGESLLTGQTEDTPVAPEPTSVTLLALGVAGVAALRGRVQRL